MTLQGIDLGPEGTHECANPVCKARVRVIDKECPDSRCRAKNPFYKGSVTEEDLERYGIPSLLKRSEEREVEVSSLPGNEQECAERFAHRHNSKGKICECTNPISSADSDTCVNCGGNVTFNPSSVYRAELPVNPERMNAVNELTQDLADWERDSSTIPGGPGAS